MTSIIASMLFIVSIILPIRSQYDLYIKIFGIILSCLVIITNFDWAAFGDMVSVNYANFYDWLMVKFDGNKDRVNVILTVILFILSQVIILPSYSIWKRIK